MKQTTKPDITLPNRAGQGADEILRNDSNIVIIGANGSGKTRLGAWIEKVMQEKAMQNNLTVHRISAQRALGISEYVAVKSLEQAERSLRYGREDMGEYPYVIISNRWGNNPETHMLQDYGLLLSTLFARATERDRKYTKSAQANQVYVPVVDAPTDVIIKIWQEVMPQREIFFDDYKVRAKKAGQDEYHGKGMSDGERVTLYLIGQCLCAPDNSIVIIDEPEIHMHKSLMTRLWNKIEEICPNKLLVFITHDLDFAASRKEATKLWIKDYDGATSWTWEEVPEIEAIPENLVVEILGSRKDIIFCEGEKASYDAILYQVAFPDCHIIPRGGCEKVIRTTKAVREDKSPFQHLRAFGIIDRDYRADKEIDALEQAGIYAINVAEVENLFCTEPIIRIVASQLSLDVDKTVEKVTTFMIKHLTYKLDEQITNRAEKEIQFLLQYSKSANTEKGLKDGMEKMIRSIDIAAIYAESRKLYQQAIDEKSLEKALRLYNQKELLKEVSPLFGLEKGENGGYAKMVMRLLKSDRKAEIVVAIQNSIPELVQALKTERQP